MNQAYSTDVYHLPNIDKMMDNSYGLRLLSFMGVSSRKTQIHMDHNDNTKITFMAATWDFFYMVMPSRLQNARVTYQRMMKNVF